MPTYVVTTRSPARHTPTSSALPAGANRSTRSAGIPGAIRPRIAPRPQACAAAAVHMPAHARNPPPAWVRRRAPPVRRIIAARMPASGWAGHRRIAAAATRTPARSSSQSVERVVLLRRHLAKVAVALLEDERGLRDDGDTERGHPRRGAPASSAACSMRWRCGRVGRDGRGDRVNAAATARCSTAWIATSRPRACSSRRSRELASSGRASRPTRAA